MTWTQSLFSRLPFHKSLESYGTIWFQWQVHLWNESLRIDIFHMLFTLNGSCALKSEGREESCKQLCSPLLHLVHICGTQFENHCSRKRNYSNLLVREWVGKGNECFLVILGKVRNQQDWIVIGKHIYYAEIDNFLSPPAKSWIFLTTNRYVQRWLTKGDFQYIKYSFWYTGVYVYNYLIHVFEMFLFQGPNSHKLRK